mgnify:CR=1 FL=1
MAAPPRVLVSWHESPSYIPAPQFSPDQLIVGPQRSDEPPDVYPVVAPRGRYDLHELIRSRGIDPAFDLVVVSVDSLLRNHPANLAAFGCPLVFLAGDTHHMEAPLSTAIAYARSEPFDLVIACHNRHHMHWFVADGARQVAWLPGLIARHVAAEAPAQRRRAIAFVGQSGPLHPRRTRMLERLQQAALPVVAGRASREQSASLYAGCQVSFNASLNGDLNMRVFEVLSAGGCLLTDRLSPVSGLAQILEEGRDYLAYSDGDELLAQARALLDDPARTAAIAAAGQRRYMAELRQDVQIARMLAWVGGAEIAPLYRGLDDPRVLRGAGGQKLAGRMRAYEKVQESHRREEQLRVRIGADLPEDAVLDLADLPRLTLCLAGDRPDAAALAARARGIGAAIEVVA